MNSENQWKIVNDKHHFEAMQRERDELALRQKLKQAYMNDLSNQIKTNEELKKREKSL
jgi:hypothetical protein